MKYVSSSSQIVNANCVLIHILAYNLFNWIRRLVLRAKFRKDRIDTLLVKLMKIAARIVHTTIYVMFRLCCRYPLQHEFYETLKNISQLQHLQA